jgi:hypothetical protein
MITTYIQACLWAARHKDNAFLDVSIFMFCSVHALIQLADMQAYLVKDSERAFIEGTIALDEEVAAHQKLQKAQQGQELESWLFSIPAGSQKVSWHIGCHVPPQRAVWRRIQAEHPNHQDAVKDECLILPSLGVPTVPQVYWKQVRYSFLSRTCRKQTRA